MLSPTGRATRSASCKPHELVFLSPKTTSNGSFLFSLFAPAQIRRNSNSRSLSSLVPWHSTMTWVIYHAANEDEVARFDNARRLPYEFVLFLRSFEFELPFSF